MAIVRRRYVFTGSVQGVGFRYRAFYAARENGVSGWVKNEYDGSVSMEAQGTPADLRQLIAMIRDARYIEIDDLEEKNLPTEKEERQFVVRH